MNNATADFAFWRARRHEALKERTFPESSIRGLTVLAYFFWNDERLERDLWTIEFSFRQTFSVLGRLPAVLVTNRMTDGMSRLSAELGVEIQIEPSLTRGLPSMSIDCIAKLHERFTTGHVLIIQNDGMPLRAGIEEFLGKYDYVGAPWPGHCTWYDLFPYPRFGVGNGGFSLRSKALCEYVADCHRRFFRWLPYTWLFTEDVFYCKTLPLLHPALRRRFRYATISEAFPFAYEHAVPNHPLSSLPFGFHSVKAFNVLAEKLKVES